MILIPFVFGSENRDGKDKISTLEKVKVQEEADYHRNLHALYFSERPPLSVTQTGMGRSERRHYIGYIHQRAEWVRVEVLLSEGTAWEGHGFCKK